MITSIDMRPAAANDIPEMMELNHKWLRQNLGNDISQGFLSGAFSQQDFEDMIADKMICVAIDKGRVVAYMLSMNNAKLDILAEHKEMADEIRKNKTISKNSRVAVGIQTAVEEEYHGSGLIIMVRKFFLKMLSDRFDYLLTTISKQNIRSYKSATKFGWQIVGDNEEHFFLILKV